jgi:hypothetical protein
MLFGSVIVRTLVAFAIAASSAAGRYASAGRPILVEKNTRNALNVHQSSLNWAGAGYTTSPSVRGIPGSRRTQILISWPTQGSFKSVTGTFTIPQHVAKPAGAGKGEYSVAVWVGIDGVTCPSSALWQAGLFFNVSDSGAVVYERM